MKTRRVIFRVNPDHLARWQKAQATAGSPSLTAWVTNTLNTAAQDGAAQSPAAGAPAPAKPKRTGPCPHRRLPDTYCPRCDQ
jgi:hypothetical protein